MKIVDSVYVYRMFLGDKASWNGRYHSHKENEFEIHFFIEGSGVFLSNKKRIPIHNKNLFITSPREFHSILPDKIEKPITYYAILFSLDKKDEGEMFESLCRIAESNKKRQTIEESSIQFIFEEIFKLSNSKDAQLKKSAELLTEGLIYRLFMSNAEPTGAAQDYQQKTEEISSNHVSRSIHIMEEKIYENLKVEELAAELGLSAEHFIRIFRQKMNITPLQYFYRLKIKTAAAMISNTSLLVNDIAKKMSFENQFHFSRIFKKCTGLSPTEYRKMYGQKIR